MSQINTPPTIMILDDDPIFLKALPASLIQMGYEVLVADNYLDFTQKMTPCDVVLCDILLPGNNGLQALKWTHKNYPDTVVIMVTGYPSYKTAAEAIRLGAYDYLVKPISLADLQLALQRAIQHRHLQLTQKKLEQENETYRLSLEQQVEKQTQALRHSQEFLKTLTNTIGDVVLSLKMPDYRIEYVNRAVTDMLGYKPDELSGQTVHILYNTPAKFNIFSRKQETTIAQGQTQMRLEQGLRKKNGESVWTEIASTFIHVDNQLSQIILVIRDITQRSFLLGVVAHELQGPLNLLAGFSQAISDDIETLDQQSMVNYLGAINDNITRMRHLIDGLLDITKADLGDFALEIKPTDINKLLKTHTQDYVHLAAKKDIKLKEQLALKPLICECDSVKIEQVISNFIDNAIKYSNSGTTVEVIGKHQVSKIWVGIKDEGQGIKPEEVEYLFTGFGNKKISSQPTAGEHSTGLGLAICKKIIESHGGQVGVDTALGQGSTFWFSLPLKAGKSGM